MSIIYLRTDIKAPIARVFDLARSIDLHTQSTLGTEEKAIAGKTTGLIGWGETVTWKAKHFGIYHELTVEIIEFDSPIFFVDEMQKGIFKSMKHTHRFEVENNGVTSMFDQFQFTAPFGMIGKLADVLFLKNYMKRFLLKKNEELKKVAEGTDWDLFF